jgi:hypothetical protein
MLHGHEEKPQSEGESIKMFIELLIRLADRAYLSKN